MASPSITDVLAAAGGISAVAKALNMSDEGVRLWTVRGVPPKHVIWLAERTEWKFRPHQIAREIYPHPDDGVPLSQRQQQPNAA